MEPALNVVVFLDSTARWTEFLSFSFLSSLVTRAERERERPSGSSRKAHRFGVVAVVDAALSLSLSLSLSPCRSVVTLVGTERKGP